MKQKTNAVFSIGNLFPWLCLGCSTNRYFEPTFTFMGLLHDDYNMSGHHCAVEDRTSRCGHPPSFARRQNREERHFGYNFLQKSIECTEDNPIQKIDNIQKNSAMYKR